MTSSRLARHPVLFKRETTSTMEDAREALKLGYTDGCVCLSAHQNSGRGRITGRVWEDSGEDSLLFTLILRRDRLSARYPLTQLAALAFCDHLEAAHGLSPCIKWPNDVLVDGRKIAGILVETEGDFFLLGMGVNVAQKDFSGKFPTPPVSIAQAVSGSRASFHENLHPETELEGFLKCLDALVDTPAPVSRVASRLQGLNLPVSVLLGHPEKQQRLNGVVSGLAEDGALVVRDDSGRFHEIYSGEIRRIQCS